VSGKVTELHNDHYAMFAQLTNELELLKENITRSLVAAEAECDVPSGLKLPILRTSE
jgi:hypothetical protein